MIETIIFVTVAITLLVTKAVKDGEFIPSRFIPTFGLVFGGILGGIFAYFYDASFLLILAGMLTNGLYDNIKVLKK